MKLKNCIKIEGLLEKHTILGIKYIIFVQYFTDASESGQLWYPQCYGTTQQLYRPVSPNLLQILFHNSFCQDLAHLQGLHFN